MGARNFWRFTLLSFCLFLISGHCYCTQLDTIPIVNPTTPTPIVIPISPPAPPTSTDPFVTPTAPTTATPTTTPVSSSGTWCIASSIASPTALQVALDYACGYGGTDCSAIQLGAGCYEPNTVRDHASYAFNDYYQKNPVPTSCVFGGTAQLSTSDPSHDSCHFASPGTTPSTSSPPVSVTPTPVIPTSPTTTTPTMSTPTDSSGYVPEPTGSPSSTATISPSLPFLFLLSGLWGAILAANNVSLLLM